MQAIEREKGMENHENAVFKWVMQLMPFSEMIPLLFLVAFIGAFMIKKYSHSYSNSFF